MRTHRSSKSRRWSRPCRTNHSCCGRWLCSRTGCCNSACLADNCRSRYRQCLSKGPWCRANSLQREAEQSLSRRRLCRGAWLIALYDPWRRATGIAPTFVRRGPGRVAGADPYRVNVTNPSTLAGGARPLQRAAIRGVFATHKGRVRRAIGTESQELDSGRRTPPTTSVSRSNKENSSRRGRGARESRRIRYRDATSCRRQRVSARMPGNFAEDHGTPSASPSIIRRSFRASGLARPCEPELTGAGHPADRAGWRFPPRRTSARGGPHLYNYAREALRSRAPCRSRSEHSCPQGTCLGQCESATTREAPS